MAQVPQIPGDINQEDLLNSMNNLVRESNSRDVTQIYKDDSGNYGVIIGKKPSGKRGILIYNNGVPQIDFGQLEDGTSGMKVSEDGTNVLTADNEELVFNSAQNVFKIIYKGTSSIPSFVTGTGQSASLVTIPHGQSFTPIVQVYVQGYILDVSASIIASSYIQLPIARGSAFGGNYYFDHTDGQRDLAIVYAVDDTNIYVQAASDSTAGAKTMHAIPVTYYILQETAN